MKYYNQGGIYMPVHFNSFIPDKEEELKTNLFANIVQKYSAI